MDNQYRSLAGLGQTAAPVTPIIYVPPPSLEQRLDHLCRGVERACAIRAKLSNIAEGISMSQTDEAGGSAAPAASDLSGRFGDSIGHLHVNLDLIEQLVYRIEVALFDEKKQTGKMASPGRG